MEVHVTKILKILSITHTVALVCHSTLVLTAKMVSNRITSVNTKYVTKHTLTLILSQTDHVQCDYLTSAIMCVHRAMTSR